MENQTILCDENEIDHLFFCLIIMQCDLLEMPAVAQLEKDSKYALVFELLKIFLVKRLDAYLDFYTTNSELLKSYGDYQYPI